MPKLFHQQAATTPVNTKVSGFDDALFEAFFKENFASLCTYCQFKFGIDAEVAKDATHSAFLKFWENRFSIDPGAKARAYLFTIANNMCLDILRHNQVKRNHEIYTLHTANEALETTPTEYKQLYADVRKAVDELPVQMRKVFELSRFEGLKYAEIAAELNLSVKTVETQMGRALAKLKARLSHYLVLLMTLSFLFL